MDGGTVIFTFKGDTKDLEKKTKSVGASVSDIIKGSLASKAIAKGIQAIASNTGDAVKRVDQLNQFPKVMNSLGISTEDANEALKQVDKSILGLPTTLNQAAQGIQRLTAKNEDVKKSATYFTAMNDAILSGTNDTALYNSALEQMMQAYSKGKPDLIEFRSWINAMPGQLKLVAQTMGFVDTDALYEGFKNGSVTMEDFMQTLVKLDTEGSGNFSSFSESARANCEGIETSIANLKTSIVRGLGNSIKSLNTALEESGLPNISEIIQGIGSIINDVFNGAIIPLIQNLVPFLAKVGELIKEHPQEIMIIAGVVAALVGQLNILSSFGTKISNIKIGFDLLKQSLGGVKNIFNLLKGEISQLMPVFSTIGGLIKTGLITAFNSLKSVIVIVGGAFKTLGATLLANPIVLVIAGIIALVVTIVTLYNKCEWFRNGVNAIFTFIKNGAISFVNGVKSVFGSFINFVTSIPKKIISIFTSLPNQMANIGKNIIQGLTNGIKNMVSGVENAVKGVANKVTGTFKKILHIGSPSKVFFDYGKFTDEGYINGIDKMAPQIQESLKNMVDLSPTLTGTTSANLSPNIVVNNDMAFETDPLGQVVKKIKTYSGGSKNDYNYGMGA